MNKYYIFCSDVTREGWFEEFKTLKEAKEYLKENYKDCEILIIGKEIEYTKNNGIIKFSMKDNKK